MFVKDNLSLDLLAPSRYNVPMARTAQDEIKRAIAKRLREARESLGLTQLEAGRQAGFGDEAQSRVSHYERAKRNVTRADLIALAKVYGKSPVNLTFDVRELPTEEDELLPKYRVADQPTKRHVKDILDTYLRHRKASKKGRERSG
jgi:transcriptional regulator with XRE-family HTH domain